MELPCIVAFNHHIGTSLMSDDSEKNSPLRAGMEFCGEVLVPGGSNLVKGDWIQAGIHACLGIAARSALGLPGLLIVSSNSIVRALTGRNIYDLAKAPAVAAPPLPEPPAPVQESSSAPPIEVEEPTPSPRVSTPPKTSTPRKKGRSAPIRKSKPL